MKELAFRLRKNADLKQSLEQSVQQQEIDTAVVLSAVGCLSKVKIRLAGAQSYLEKQEDYEIVSLMGTLSKGKAHLHISLSDDKGNCIGGHLDYGCLINTTCEVVLGLLEEYESVRQMDESTGYKEIVFTRKCKEGE